MEEGQKVYFSSIRKMLCYLKARNQIAKHSTTIFHSATTKERNVYYSVPDKFKGVMVNRVRIRKKRLSVRRELDLNTLADKNFKNYLYKSHSKKAKITLLRIKNSQTQKEKKFIKNSKNNNQLSH